MRACWTLPTSWRFPPVPSADDPFDLARFVAAQDEGGTYGRALREVEQRLLGPSAGSG